MDAKWDVLVKESTDITLVFSGPVSRPEDDEDADEDEDEENKKSKRDENDDEEEPLWICQAFRPSAP